MPSGECPLPPRAVLRIERAEQHGRHCCEQKQQGAFWQVLQLAVLGSSVQPIDGHPEPRGLNCLGAEGTMEQGRWCTEFPAEPRMQLLGKGHSVIHAFRRLSLTHMPPSLPPVHPATHPPTHPSSVVHPSRCLCLSFDSTVSLADRGRTLGPDVWVLVWASPVPACVLGAVTGTL